MDIIFMLIIIFIIFLYVINLILDIIDYNEIEYKYKKIIICVFSTLIAVLLLEFITLIIVRSVL